MNTLKHMSDLERKILSAIQHGFPNTPTPYQDITRRINVEVEELLNVLKEWKKQGAIRRIGAVVNPAGIGISAGAMVVWQVQPDRIEQVGRLFGGFENVSHVYERATADNWPYNVYTMVHGVDSKDIEKTIRRMSDSAGVSRYRILTTERELKKAPPTYIPEPAC